MINEDNKFQSYATTMVREVPESELKYLVVLFMKEACINMGCDVTEETIDRVIYFVKAEYSYIPVNYIASALISGSLGKIGDGKGRLVPKTILAWLAYSTQEYNRHLASITERNKLNDVSIAMNLHKYPAGMAIDKKIDWYKKGLLRIEDWDKVPLMDLAERIKNKLETYPAIYGITYKK